MHNNLSKDLKLGCSLFIFYLLVRKPAVKWEKTKKGLLVTTPKVIPEFGEAAIVYKIKIQ